MREVFEKIIEKLEKLMPFATVGVTFIGQEEAVKVARKIAAEYNNGWIPCSERLPVGKEWEINDEDGDVLYKHVLCHTDNRDVPIAVGFYQESIWFTADTYDTINVIAWQPLPAPYKPKGEES